MANTVLRVGHTRTLTGNEMFQGQAVPAQDIKNLSWSTDSPSKVALTPSADTLTCVITGVDVVVSAIVTAQITEHPSVSGTMAFDVVYPVDAVVITAGPEN